MLSAKNNISYGTAKVKVTMPDQKLPSQRGKLQCNLSIRWMIILCGFVFKIKDLFNSSQILFLITDVRITVDSMFEFCSYSYDYNF